MGHLGKISIESSSFGAKSSSPLDDKNYPTMKSLISFGVEYSSSSSDELSSLELSYSY